MWSRSLVSVLIGDGLYVAMSSVGSKECHRLDGDVNCKFPEVPGFATGTNLIGTVTCFLLVYRTGNAFSRWWEARGHIGAICFCVRCISNSIASAASTAPPSAAVTDWKKQLKSILCSYMHIMAAVLSGKNMGSACATLSVEQQKMLQISGSPPYTVLCYWISLLLQNGVREGVILPSQFAGMDQSLQALLQASHGAHKVANTPMPFVYRWILKSLLAFFTWFLLPFTMVYLYFFKLTPYQLMNPGLFHFAQGDNSHPLFLIFNFQVFLYSSTLWAILTLGQLMADPYGDDLVDLPVSNMANRVQKDLESVFTGKLDLSFVVQAKKDTIA